MNLTDLGYNEDLEKYRNDNDIHDMDIGRIVSEHKERYIVKTENGEYEAEITGNLRYSAKNREDFPAVGDWVALIPYDSSLAIIHSILPRSSTISRQAVGKQGEIQIIATNIDYAFLVQAVDRDFNINRLERYLAICYSSKVSPIIVLTKTDLITALAKAEIIERINQRIDNVPVFAISNSTQEGYEALESVFEPSKTYCMLGSSGVGKSSLLNNLSGKIIMETDSISQSTNKGRHVSSHRELAILGNGSILIDNPGMREVGVADISEGLETTFDLISELAQNCKYSDCTHINEAGCSVLEALEDGDLDKNYYNNYLKIQKENTFFESTVADRKKKDKDLGKVIKHFKKTSKRN